MSSFSELQTVKTCQIIQQKVVGSFSRLQTTACGRDDLFFWSSHDFGRKIGHLRT